MKYSLENGLGINMDNKVTNILIKILVGFLALLLLIGGICKAYDAYVINSLETSYTSNIRAIEAWQKSGTLLQTACEASYQALLAYKKENDLPIISNQSGCPLTTPRQ